MITVEGFKITPTIFPDKTSQVWKLPEEIINKIHKYKKVEVLWEFESEDEIIHFLQLKTLVYSYGTAIYLKLPYLPYARQDKEVSNSLTFALKTFCDIIRVDTIEIFDPHCKKELLEKYFWHSELVIKPPDNQVKNAFEDSNSTVICYPDKGAAQRYKKHFSAIVLDKVRDQLTGEITGLKVLDNQFLIFNANILIQDDLCDGGRTFIEAAKLLYSYGAKEVNLYVSHGIFSKGLKRLREAGIKRIYTKEGLIRSL